MKQILVIAGLWIAMFIRADELQTLHSQTEVGAMQTNKTIIARKQKNLETMYIAPKDAHSFGYNNCNMRTNGELSVIKQLIFSSDIIFDVGANKGEWSNHVLKHASSTTVYSFEPIPFVYEGLKASLKNQAHVYNLAFTNTQGTKKFYCYENSELSSFFDREVLRHLQRTSITVTSDTLDNFCRNQAISEINFLKIDTEGAELNILLGAQCLLEKGALQLIQFEYGGCYNDAQTTLYEVYMLLTRMGYKVARITQDGLIPIHAWEESLENYQYSNYLAIAPKLQS